MRIKGIYDKKSQTIETVDGEIYEIEPKRVETCNTQNIIMAKIVDGYYNDINGTKFNFVVFGFNNSSKGNIDGVLAEKYNEACDIYLEGIAEDM